MQNNVHPELMTLLVLILFKVSDGKPLFIQHTYLKKPLSKTTLTGKRSMTLPVIYLPAAFPTNFSTYLDICNRTETTVYFIISYRQHMNMCIEKKPHRNVALLQLIFRSATNFFGAKLSF